MAYGYNKHMAMHVSKRLWLDAYWNLLSEKKSAFSLPMQILLSNHNHLEKYSVDSNHI